MISDERNSYTYDSLGELVQTNGAVNSSYTYDSRGNMLSKAVNDETTTFEYGNTQWQDQLTKVNGKSLTYDANGNLQSYDGAEYTWSHGKRLSSITKGDTTYEYKYDLNGIRSYKTVNGVTTKFDTLNGKILAQSDVNNKLLFQYNGDALIGFELNGTQYFYLTNLSGDVVGITDADGNLIAKYSYDEWGKLLAIETAEENNAEQLAIAEANPLRYRGYYYDNETGMYYLQSRYYNPEFCRFISADSFDFIEDFSCFGINAYIYCNNDPIVESDPNGNKSVDKETKNMIIGRYKKCMSSLGYAYVYNNSETDNYKVTIDSNGIVSLTGEHRFNSGKKYYNSVFIYGKTDAWANEYQDARREYETSKGLFDGLMELATIPYIITIIIMLLTGLFVLGMREVVLQDEMQKALERYNKSKKKGYYEYMETLSKTTFSKGKATTTYLISH